jgi:hypothetical protein
MAANLAPRRRLWVSTARGGVALLRRGVRHGRFRPGGAVDVAGDPSGLWAAAEPLHFAGALRAALRAHAADIRRTRRLFDRLGAGGEFRREIWRRLARRSGFVAGGASRDLADPKEVEKVHADLPRAGRDGVDLWVKLSRISLDARDPSLRIRVSFGSELHDDWRKSPRRARAADALAEAVFPECRALARDGSARRFLRRATRGGVRLSERILFANAPGGGAAFHHDAETGQLGVAYAQLAGRTAWLALPKRELAGVAARLAAGRLAARLRTARRSLRALDRGLPPLERLLNADPRLTRALAAAGRLYVLAPGDLLLLPSPGPDDAAWHSVFALGRRASLALSFGIFRDPAR